MLGYKALRFQIICPLDKGRLNMDYQKQWKGKMPSAFRYLIRKLTEWLTYRLNAVSNNESGLWVVPHNISNKLWK